MGYLYKSCIGEDVHDTGDAVEHVEEDAEQQYDSRGVVIRGCKIAQYTMVINKAAVVAKF